MMRDGALVAACPCISIRVTAASPLSILHALLRIGLMGHVVGRIRIPLRGRILRLTISILVRNDLLGAALSRFDRTSRDGGALARIVVPRLRHKPVISFVVSMLSLLRHSVARFPRHWRFYGFIQANGRVATSPWYIPRRTCMRA